MDATVTDDDTQAGAEALAAALHEAVCAGLIRRVVRRTCPPSTLISVLTLDGWFVDLTVHGASGNAQLQQQGER